MGLLTILLGLILIGGIGGTVGYYTVDEVKDFIHGGLTFLKALSDSIPQLYEFVATIGGFLFNFIGFFLTHIPFMFAMTQIFFMFMAMSSTAEYSRSKSFNIINVYLSYNRKMFSFLINLFVLFTNIVINLVKAVGNYIPFT